MPTDNTEKEYWLDLISARAGYLANQLSTNSPELFGWRDKIMRAYGVDPVSGSYDAKTAPFLKLNTEGQAYILAGIISEKMPYAEALEKANGAIKEADRIVPKPKPEGLTDSLLIQTDGASRGNPGPASIGFIIMNGEGDIVHQHGEYIGTATNNHAEYKALETALIYLQSQGGADLKLRLELDSELVVKQLTGIYKIKDSNLAQIAGSIKSLLKEIIASHTINHIPRAENSRADALCNEALDQCVG